MSHVTPASKTHQEAFERTPPPTPPPGAPGRRVAAQQVKGDGSGARPGGAAGTVVFNALNGRLTEKHQRKQSPNVTLVFSIFTVSLIPLVT